MEKRVVFRSRWLPYALVAPQLAITIAFFFWPASQTLYQSFLLQDPFGSSVQFVGLENFRELFADQGYRASFRITALYSVLVAGIGLVLSLLLAVMADHIVRGALAFRTLLIWPYAVAPAIAGVLWIFMFSPSIGILPYWLGRIGYTWNHLLNGNQAMTLVVVAAVWKQVSYNFLFFVAGLQSIPKSLIEAAAMDGAGPMRRFWTIVFPLISPTTFFLLVVNIVFAFFDTFGIIDTMTRGGPAKATETLVYKVYSDGLLGGNLGSSAAQSVILMIMVIVLTGIQFRFVERKVTY